jgi:hypothetical protein
MAPFSAAVRCSSGFPSVKNNYYFCASHPERIYIIKDEKVDILWKRNLITVGILNG